MDTPNSNESGLSNSNEPGPSLVPRSENGLENESAEETPRFTPPTKPKRSKLSQISNMINDLREINDNTRCEETDLDLFGKSVSAQLKKLTEEQAVIAKEKIQSILTQCMLTDIRAKNAYQVQQSVQQSQNTLPTNWNSTQVLPSYIVPQYSLTTPTICPPPESSPSTCSSSCSQFTTNVISPETPYNYDSYGESVDNSDAIQQAFKNA